MMGSRLFLEQRFLVKAHRYQSALRARRNEEDAGEESLEDFLYHLGELGAPSAFARNLPPRSPGLIDLQWFAAEDEGRTEEPSEYKLRKAREEGRVAKSQELVAAIGLLLPAAAIVILSPYLAKTMRDMVLYFLGLAGKADITTDGGVIALAFFEYFAKLTLPVAAVAVVAAILSNILQVGFLFTAKPITPDFSKIVPHFGQYLKRTMFSVEGLFNLAKSIAKVLIIGFVSYLVIQGEFDKLRTLFEGPFWPSVSYIFSLAMRLVIIVAVAMLVLAIPDYMFQRRQYMEGLKMTKEEVKEERKMQEGDPMVKGRLREMMRELLSRNMAANVPKADVVITNPTHFAIALEWDRERMVAPTVTAKGMDEVAQRIKRIAIDNGVPLVENRPLARALYADVEIGDAIPDKYYQAIAAVLAHVYGSQGAEGGEEGQPSLAGAAL
jgi:flagellar biosynthetic protein FlhB